MNMIKKVTTPRIYGTNYLKARSNGIQIAKTSDVTYVWPVRVKNDHGSIKVVPSYFGKVFFDDQLYYDFSEEKLSGQNDRWLTIDVNDKFYDVFKRIYEMNETRKLKKRVKEDQQEFARTLKSIDNPFTEKEFMEFLLEKYNIGIFFSKDHETIKAYNFTNPKHYVVKEFNGRNYYDNIVDVSRKTINVYHGFIKKYKISGAYDWDRLLYIVNAGVPRDISLHELKVQVEEWRAGKN